MLLAAKWGSKMIMMVMVTLMVMVMMTILAKIMITCEHT